jgi:flagellar biosynthetic protein FliO
MDNKLSERFRSMIKNRNNSKWLWGIILLVFFALVGFSFLISSNSNYTASEALPGKTVISSAGLFFSITLKLGVVIIMIYVFMQLLKKWQGAKQGKAKKILSVIETTYLNPRQSLHLVKAGDKLLLLGSTDQAVTYLAEFEKDLLLTDKTVEIPNTNQNNHNVVNNFASLLAQSFSKH